VQQAQQVKIFCSYAHEDQLFARQLKKHFALLERLYPWFFWTDTEISAGEEWEQTIQEHLNTAQIILLLISPDFMASDYCYSKEMKRAMERHEQKEARVIPILIRPVALWEKAPFGKLHVLPEDGKPITDRYWHTTDDALSEVVKKITQALVPHAGEYEASTTSIANSSLPQPTSPLPIVSDRSVVLVDEELTRLARPQAESEQLSTTALYLPETRSRGLALASNSSIQKEGVSVKIFGYQQDAYQFLIDMIERYGAKEAVLLQYSCQTSLNVLRVLLRKGAKATVFIQHEDTPAKIGSQFQADRIIYAMRNLRSDLGDALLKPNKLKIYKYHAPSSMSAIKIDNRLLCMGWYTYEESSVSMHTTYPDDTIEISGHDRAAVVVWQGTNEFQALDRTFNILENNYRKHAQVIPI